jgi:Dolichyl-phosphate-mannose-protein mannosyltransferase
LDRDEIRPEEEVKALVIPAYRPSGALLELIESLPPEEFAAIVVVDDGSPPSSDFVKLRDRGITVARHAVPVGRGAAIRTGMHAALAASPALDSIVVAEESHSAGEIARVSAQEDALVLGASYNVPTNWPTRVLTGIRVSDPWARLRSIPAKLIPHLLKLESNGPEFDVETLTVAAEHSIPIIEERADERADARIMQPDTARPLIWFLATTRPIRANTRLLAGLLFAVFVAVIVASIHGFSDGHLFRQFIWLPWGLHRLIHFGALFGGLSLPILLIFPWAYATVFTALLAGASVLAEGSLAVGAVLYFLLSAHTLGRAAARGLRVAKNRETEIPHTLLGIGIYSLLMTLTARLPVNYPAAWAALLSLPLALDAQGAARRLRSWFAELRSIELRNWRERAAFVLLLFVLCIHWLAALQPEYSADGLSMHLAVPADLAAHHVMTFHPDRFVWSVMPMSADFTYSIVYLMGGEAAASLLNFALLVTIVALLYRATRQWLSRESALLMAALFASAPLVNLVTGSLFIENFVAAMILGMTMELWRFHETGERRDLWLAAALAGTAASAKLGAFAFVLVALAIGIVEARRRRLLRQALAAMGILLAFAAPPYLIAFAKTGNPVFPFLNTHFPSSLLEHGIEFKNNQFTQPLSWKTPFELTFHTGLYLESLKGAFGFQYLLLVPFAAVALLAARNYGARAAAAIGLAAGAMVMASQPYARYVYPAMPLLTIPFAALVARLAPRQRWLFFSLFTAVLVCIGLNVYFIPASGWYHKDLYAPSIFRHGGRARVIREGVPLRDVTIRFHEIHPNEHVLLLAEEDLADAGSQAYEYHWHQYDVWKQIATAATVTDLRRTFSRLGIRYFIARRPGPNDDLLAPSSLAEFVANCTTPLIESGRFYAAETARECDALSDAALETKLEGLPPAQVSPGDYDDFDAALNFHGIWIRSRHFDGPFRHSISYTDSPGAKASFAFQGSSLTYMFTKSFNRGIANLEIDGTPHEIDLYAAETEWQNRVEFCCLGQGRHLAVLRATGKKRPEAADAYIDLDGFIAR